MKTDPTRTPARRPSAVPKMWQCVTWTLLAAAWLSLVAISHATAAPAPGSTDAATGALSAANVPDLGRVESIDPTAPAGRSLLVIHYHRPDGDYAGWNVWAWPDNAEGRSYAFQRSTAFGRVAIIELPGDTPRGNFIIRKHDWEQKDVGHDRAATLTDDRVAEVWLVSGDPTVYSDPGEIDFSIRPRAAFLDHLRRVRVALTAPLNLDEVDASAWRFELGDETIAIEGVSAAKGDRHAARYVDVVLDAAIAPEAVSRPMRLTLPGLEPVTVVPRDALSDEPFLALDAELGPAWSPQQTAFRTWSPVSSRVELLIYETADADEPVRAIDLDRGERGLWETSVAGDLDGVYYQYRFHRLGNVVTAPDVHAFAATADSRRSMVVDLDRTNPEGFASHEPPVLARPTDEMIYEIHVRDYSIRDPNVPEAHRGRYLGLTHESPAGTSKVAGVSTSLTHLKDLGVTAVHLMPIQDFGSERHAYNWGYWTVLFNVPESQYSTTPGDPANTIRELKRTIQTLHENDIRVILDVVYNHTAITGDPDPYEAAMPGYFFRTTDAGELRNDAGTGNSVADERPMVRKFIVDSLAYWTREYHVDGYRFDLVGTHHPETVKQITRTLRGIRPDLTLYGEPWTGGGPIYFGKGAQRGTGFAVFNDHFRNAVRGDLDGTSTGYATGPGGDVRGVRNGLAGAIDDFAEHPAESVNYVSAHDNRTFWDKLVHTHPEANDAIKKHMHRLAHGMVLTAQGIAFIHGGADYARTKGGNHNSYNAGDAVNAFDWQRKRDFIATHRYLAGLIHLRREHPAFRLDQRQDVRSHVRFLDNTVAGVVAFALDGSAVNDPWHRIVVAFNGEPDPKRLDLPRGTWKVAVNVHQAGAKQLGHARSHVTLPPYSMWVGYQD